MADKLSYEQILKNKKYIDQMLNTGDIDKEEKEELEYIWSSLESREESKFDAIISLIKDCDKQITSREKEISELKKNQEFWKNKRKNIINIIKTAYEKNLITAMPTGNKYQATIKKVKSKIIDNYNLWTKEEKNKFSLYKTTMIQRLFNGSTVDWKEEMLPDKEQLRKVISEDPTTVPENVKIVRRVSLTYNLRKRLRKGI
tara:strand:+ start:2047 stop:2649 length:603 start_codon:yes stop_codon:yes gene_type:complete